MISHSKDQYELRIEQHKIMITSPDKPLWSKKGLQKIDYLNYLVHIAPYMLPFLKERLLTVIRFPHGAGQESFYQKNCPTYAPDFVQTYKHEDINYIICSDLATFLWLGNQLAFEFHIPFQTIHSNSSPSEIVFDLDPPERSQFSLAVEAALLIKEIMEALKLITYVKTSGNKGLQIYIPLPEKTYSYEQTRVFTQFIAQYLVTKEPNWFTIERLKKHRGKRLYVDYLQHAPGKTIIAPYSVRGNEEALVATPLFWEEVKPNLFPEDFPLEVISQRIEEKGCPFSDFFQSKKKQNFASVLEWLASEKPILS